MTYNVLSGTLNPTIPYRTVPSPEPLFWFVDILAEKLKTIPAVITNAGGPHYKMSPESFFDLKFPYIFLF